MQNGQKKKLAAVSYLNTLPMLNGLRREMSSVLDIRTEHPAACAEALFNGEVDIALCPVGAIVMHSDVHVISDFAIGSRGEVRTVCVYSDLPLERLAGIRLSSESRTSNLLVQVLEHYYWNLGLDFYLPDQTLHHPADMVGTLCIGDKCFELEGRYEYVTDLGSEWTRNTGLAMAFACWVSLREQEEQFIERFNAAIAGGVAEIETMELPQGENDPGIRQYLTTNIAFELDKSMRLGMKKFIELASKLPVSLSNAAQGTPG